MRPMSVSTTVGFTQLTRICTSIRHTHTHTRARECVCVCVCVCMCVCVCVCVQTESINMRGPARSQTFLGPSSTAMTRVS
jgi:hypothetical protein